MTENTMSTPMLLFTQIRFQNRAFWRTPVAAFFTLVLPLVFVLLFNVFFGDELVNGEPYAQFFTPAMAVFAAVAATFTNLAIATSLVRDQGVLKRVRGTPLPPWIYMAGRIGSAVWTAALSVALLFVVGWALFDFEIIWGNFAVAVLVFIVGMATFSVLGLAVCGVIKRSEAIPAVAQAIVLPMAFISGIFIPLEDAPDWLTLVGDILPMKHLNELFGASFSPFVTGPILGWERLGVLVAWFAFGLFITTRYFTWDPRD